MQDYEYALSPDEIDEAIIDVTLRHQVLAGETWMNVLRDVYRVAYNAGADRVQQEWDLAEDLAFESSQGWDF